MTRFSRIKAAASKAAQPPLSRGHQPGSSEASFRANPFARPDLWQAFRFTGYFQRETVAVFARCTDAENFCLANIGGVHGNGYFVAGYRRVN